MKKILLVLLTLSASSAFANPKVVYSKAASKIEKQDACVGVAVETILWDLGMMEDDPYGTYGRDTFNVSNVEISKPGTTYRITANVNMNNSEVFTVEVQCSGIVKH